MSKLIEKRYEEQFEHRTMEFVKKIQERFQIEKVEVEKKQKEAEQRAEEADKRATEAAQKATNAV